MRKSLYCVLIGVLSLNFGCSESEIIENNNMIFDVADDVGGAYACHDDDCEEGEESGGEEGEESGGEEGEESGGEEGGGDDEQHLKIDCVESCGGWCDDNDECHPYMKEGENCTDEDLCEFGLTCFEGVCEVPWSGTDECDAKYKPCENENDVCFEGECIANLPCTSNADCQNDTYCCLDESCGQPICVPFGKGPGGEYNALCSSDVRDPLRLTLQCKWVASTKDVKTKGDKNDYSKYKNVGMSPIVIDTPHDTGNAKKVAFLTARTDVSSSNKQVADGNCYERRGVLRILNGSSCKLVETINTPCTSGGKDTWFSDNDVGDDTIAPATQLASADIDNDGNPEIIAVRIIKQVGKSTGKSTSVKRPGGGLVALRWNEKKKKYVKYWSTESSWEELPQIWNETTTMYVGGAPAIHDINNDGVPEVICKGEVFNGKTGKRLNKDQTLSSVRPVVGDIDGDGKAELLDGSSIYRWNSNKWKSLKKFSDGSERVFADFGSYGEDGKFDFTKLDGKAELAACRKGYVQIHTTDGKNLFKVTAPESGGLCSVADFDGDGLPEIAEMFKSDNTVRVFDPQCGESTPGCKAKGLLWSRKQAVDVASQMPIGADLDGDGAAEVLAATATFLHVIDGRTGQILDSVYRQMRTAGRASFVENPVVADVDGDGAAEIILTSSKVKTDTKLDPYHRGLMCNVDSDCPSGVCKRGLCRCTKHAECNTRVNSAGEIFKDYACTDGITDNDKADGKVCRAYKPTDATNTGIRIYKSARKPFAPARSLWNQFSYNVTNVKDDQTVPKTDDWHAFVLEKAANLFRGNVTEKKDKNLPAVDLTSKILSTSCAGTAENAKLAGFICNRGAADAPVGVPASFYANDVVLCTAKTVDVLPPGKCAEVSCAAAFEPGTVIMRANDSGTGGLFLNECDPENNSSEYEAEACK